MRLVLMVALAATLLVSPVRAQEADSVALHLVGLEWVSPIGLHAGIWSDVVGCARREGDFAGVAWAVADTVFDVRSGRLAYGATVTGYWDTVVIIIERPYWLNPEVLSHEVLHALGASHGDRVYERCAMRVGSDPLPVRVRR